VADIERIFREAWSRAVTGVTAAEQEAEKVLGRMADAAGFSAEDLRRQARDLGDRLQAQTREIEKAIDEGVRKAAGQLQAPAQRELEALKKRMDDLTARIEAMGRPKGGEEKKP
jgi:polyhydroxyalkanoate synthesis regulator phasin